MLILGITGFLSQPAHSLFNW